MNSPNSSPPHLPFTNFQSSFSMDSNDVRHYQSQKHQNPESQKQYFKDQIHINSNNNNNKLLNTSSQLQDGSYQPLRELSLQYSQKASTDSMNQSLPPIQSPSNNFFPSSSFDSINGRHYQFNNQIKISSSKQCSMMQLNNDSRSIITNQNNLSNKSTNIFSQLINTSQGENFSFTSNYEEFQFQEQDKFEIHFQNDSIQEKFLYSQQNQRSLQELPPQFEGNESHQQQEYQPLQQPIQQEQSLFDDINQEPYQDYPSNLQSLIPNQQQSNNSQHQSYQSNTIQQNTNIENLDLSQQQTIIEEVNSNEQARDLMNSNNKQESQNVLMRLPLKLSDNKTLQQLQQEEIQLKQFYQQYLPDYPFFPDPNIQNQQWPSFSQKQQQNFDLNSSHHIQQQTYQQEINSNQSPRSYPIENNLQYESQNEFKILPPLKSFQQIHLKEQINPMNLPSRNNNNMNTSLHFQNGINQPSTSTHIISQLFNTCEGYNSSQTQNIHEEYSIDQKSIQKSFNPIKQPFDQELPAENTEGLFNSTFLLEAKKQSRIEQEQTSKSNQIKEKSSSKLLSKQIQKKSQSQKKNPHFMQLKVEKKKYFNSNQPNCQFEQRNQQPLIVDELKNIPSNNCEGKLNTYKISFYDMNNKSAYFSKLLLSSTSPQNKPPKYLKVENGVLKSTNFKNFDLGEDTNNVSHYVVDTLYKNLNFRFDLEYSESIPNTKNMGKEVRKWKNSNVEEQKKIQFEENLQIVEIMIKQRVLQKERSTVHQLLKYGDSYLTFFKFENKINQIKQMRSSTLEKLKRDQNNNNLV